MKSTIANKRNNSEGERAKLRAAFLFVCAVLVGLALSDLLFWKTGIGCPIRYLTGVPCPGCGMTRAWFAVVHGDLAAAFAYHPLFWAVPLAAALGFARVAARQKSIQRAFDIALAAIAVAFIALWMIRLIDPASIIYVTEPAWIEFVGAMVVF